MPRRGGDVLEPASSLRRALAIPNAGQPGNASLDMNLSGDSSAPIAAALREREVPFVVITGYSGKHSEDPMFQDVPVIKKPYQGSELVRALADLLA